MGFFSKLKLRQQLYLMLAAPLLGLFYFSATQIWEKMAYSTAIGHIQAISTLSTQASALVHEMQKERGATAGFLGSKGKKFTTKLPAQRQLTNEKLRIFQDAFALFDLSPYRRELRSNLEKAIFELGRLGEVRQSVSALAIAAPVAISYYTAVNAKLLDAIGQASLESPDPALSTQLMAYAAFLKSKERAGIERAVLSNTFAKGRFTGKMFEYFSELVAQQKTYLDVFIGLASPEQMSFFHTTSSAQPFSQVRQYRRAAFDGQAAGTELTVDSVVWFDTITKKINLLKQVENRLSEDLDRSAAKLQSGVALVYTVAAAALSGTLLISMLINVSINRRLTNYVMDISNSSTQVAAASDEISSGAQQLSQGATEQAASLEQTSATMEEVASQAKDNSTNADQTTATVEEMNTMLVQSAEFAKEGAAQAMAARQASDQGVDAMKNISNSMKEIQEGSSKIADIIEIINEITHQTKMLATNAAIEAARAGEHGKGFAVVADEVSKLAQSSKSSAKEISTLIRSSVKKSQAGGEFVKKGEEVLRNISTNSGKAQELIEKISAFSETQSSKMSTVQDMTSHIKSASNEQANGVGQVSQALAQMDDVTQRNAANAEESAASAEELTSQAEALEELVAQMSIHFGVKLQTQRQSARASRPPQIAMPLGGERVARFASQTEPIASGKRVKPSHTIPMQKDFTEF